MQFSTLFITLFASVGITLAAPTPGTKRTTCQRALSDINGFNVIYRPDMIHVHRNTNVSFIVPPNASGPCTLVGDFPANFDIYDSSVQAGGQPLQVNIFDIDGPTHGSLLGTTQFPVAGPDQKTKEASKRTINSFACREKMDFRFEAAELGTVEFMQTNDAGIFLEYGC
ncbi:hypothetical protein QBC41DRAFT_317817 [Cercophora samala]|uniref:Uncharacterized protein n=1 Tax=Cercophora samala TaxID=330535 RepID=A0AA39ZGA2_9PEZI|nr:hypothetical protein QBC41DRAFT_317817 [Cercophora samala]